MEINNNIQKTAEQMEAYDTMMRIIKYWGIGLIVTIVLTMAVDGEFDPLFTIGFSTLMYYFISFGAMTHSGIIGTVLGGILIMAGIEWACTYIGFNSNYLCVILCFVPVIRLIKNYLVYRG